MGRSVATTSDEMPITAATSAAASTSFHPLGTGCSRIVVMVRRNGATTRIPIASPAHHTDQAPRNSLPSITPEASNVVAPIVALISMLASAARNTIASASRSRSSWGRNPTRSSRMAAASGASVFPAAVVAAANGVALIVRLTANAAIATPGHSRLPRRRNPTSAIPVGGHNGVMFSPTSASWRLSCAAR